MARQNALARSRQSAGRNVGHRAPPCNDCGMIRVAGSCACTSSPVAASMFQPSAAPVPAPVVARASGWLSACEFDLVNVGVNMNALRRSMLAQFGDRREPYVDKVADCSDMDTLYSTIVDGATGGVEQTIEIQPVRGSFVAFYYDIVVWTTADGEPEPLWTYRRPRIDGCPIPCDDLEKQIRGTFAEKVAEACCCGVPFVALLQRSSEDAPLQIPITIPELASAQVRLFGFCCSNRLC